MRTGKPELRLDEICSGDTLSELAHKIGHDIGNPLTSIISHATILSRFSDYEAEGGEAGDDLSSYADSIVGEAWKIGDIAERLVLLLSTRPSDLISCDIESVLEIAVLRLRNRMGLRQLRVEFESACRSVSALANREQLVFVLGELIQNAWRASNEKKTVGLSGGTPEPVNVSIESTRGRVRLCLRNRIDAPIEGELSDLFEPFVSRRAGDKRLGLGLTVVAAVLGRLGGEIELREENCKGGGLVFRVEVILAEGS